MQSLYALKQSEVSNYYGGLDYIAEVFSPDLNSMEKQDLQQLESERKTASGLYDQNFEKGEVTYTDESPKIKRSVETALTNYFQQVQKDKKYFSRMMMEDVEKIYDNYLLILNLLVEMADFVKEEEEEKKAKQLQLKVSSPAEYKMGANKLTRMLKENKSLELATLKRNIRVPRDLVKTICREILKNDPEYAAYQKLAEADFEMDKNIVLHIAKSIIFKDKVLQAYFEEVDLNWGENKSIEKSMVVKTLKTFEETSGPEVPLLDISSNWEEDKQFFQELYDKAVGEDKQLEEIVSEKIKNWDIERVATVDKIVLKMAVAEMLYFPSIPVKVTINEYIELSKLYSTPKSKQFINGILDAIAEELTKAGRIRKSGRGLIDNK